jgi:ATP-dependent helicase/nuclease subunit B
MVPTFQAAAAALLSDQGHRLPDLSGITVLVPHHHVRTPFIAALKAQLPASSVFLPPQFMTLPALAASCAGVDGSEPDSLRLAGLYGFLSRIDWLDDSALWPQAQAMHELLLELDDALLAPPDNYAGFAVQVEQAARRKLAAPLDTEARMIFDVWRVYQQSGAGGRKGYAGQLAKWLATVAGPLYSLGLRGLSRLELHFMAQCRESADMQELPVSVPYPERKSILDAAWQGGDDSLPERAARLAEQLPVSPLVGVMAIQAASDMEMEAQSVAAQIKSWLAEGRRNIAVIALDRLAARRLRAVLERDAILMQDETGWTFSTASVSHVLDRWFTLLQDDFYHRDLLDLLKSPFVFGDVPSDVRLDAIAGLERIIARRDAVSGLQQFIALAQDDAAPLLKRFAQAAHRFRDVRKQSLSGWLETLLAALDDLGALPAIEADMAGRQLLELLHRLTRELATETSRFSLAQWRGWLNLQLDQATFQENSIESPIRLTHLAAARLRDFDAVVVLGADAGHLPPSAANGLFNDALRLQLGLPGQRQRLDETRDGLIDILTRADRVLFSWQAWRGKEPNPPSPWLILLEALHSLAYGADIRIPAQYAAHVGAPIHERGVPDFPILPELPMRISASGWQKLVSCPYRYFAHYGLGLGEAEEVAEEMEKADYGELLHAILSRFHALHPVLAEVAREQLQTDLESISREAFQEREAVYYLARGWRLRWQRHLAGYVDWALGREAEGWRWQAAEQEFSRDLELPGGRQIELYGRLDRLDQGPEGLAVIDYKAQSLPKLRGKLKTPGEDVQLPFYGLLTGAAQAGLVALDDDKVAQVRLEQPLAEAAEGEAERIRNTFAAILEGMPLPANGAPETCAWCEMRGLCRKEHEFGALLPLAD